MTQIAVIGAGAWGTTLADLLARKGAGVRLWAREPEVVASINREHVNHLFLPGAALAPEVRATGDVTEAVRAAEVVVSAAPSHAVSAVMSAAAMALRERPLPQRHRRRGQQRDRKSTRHSSHSQISDAGFCLKKK